MFKGTRTLLKLRAATEFAGRRDIHGTARAMIDCQNLFARSTRLNWISVASQNEMRDTCANFRQWVLDILHETLNVDEVETVTGQITARLEVDLGYFGPPLFADETPIGSAMEIYYRASLIFTTMLLIQSG